MDQTVCDAEGLAKVLKGVDLRSADGRAGLGSLLWEFERAEPGIIQRLCAEIELGKLRQSLPAA